ncbi:MAG: diguanylate cyclase [Cyanobacteria bacterium P01_H01_bin.58]
MLDPSHCPPNDGQKTSQLDPTAVPSTATTLPAQLSLLSLLENVSDGIEVFDLSGQRIYINHAAAIMQGYPSTEACFVEQNNHETALTYRDEAGKVLSPEDLPQFKAVQGKASTEQILYYTDYQHQERCCWVKTLTLRDDEGAIAHGLVITRDLTDLQTAKQRLQEQAQRLYQITDAVPSMIAYLDCHEHHCYANAAYLETFGHSMATITGRPLQAIVSPALYQHLQPVMRQARQHGIAEWCFPLQDQTSQTRYKHLTIIAQRCEDVVEGVYLLLNDVTAHRQTRELLTNQGTHLQQALEGGAVGIWSWDLAQNTMIWSQQQEELFGLSPGSFDGKLTTFLSLVDPRDRDRLLNQLQTANKSQPKFAAKFRVISSDGSIRWLNHRGHVLLDKQGEVVRLSGVAYDITPQKTAEEKMLRQVNRERLIAKFSQEISRTQNLDETVRQVMAEVRAFMGVDRFVIINLNDKMAGTVQYEAHDDNVRSMMDWTLRHTWVVREKLLARYRQGYPTAVTDIRSQKLDSSELTFLEYFQIASDLTVPLVQDNTLWGLLSIHHSQPRDWQGEDHRLLTTLGTQFMTVIQRYKLHQALTEANQKLQRFAYLDGLTHVANRRRFNQFLHHEWRRLMREQAPLALIMADIDNFKAYNDLYGHQVGDECLRRVAGVLRSVIQRPADMVARYGGEEFVIVLPNTGLVGAETVAEKMRILIRQQKIPHRGSNVDRLVTLSLGVASMRPHPLKSSDELVEAADRALYQAKEAGRDRVVTATPPK